jgi:hypothetical protein
MTKDEIDTYVDAAARTLALPLAPEHRPGVIHYFALAAAFADALDLNPLTLDDEPAPVFTPVSPAGGESSSA